MGATRMGAVNSTKAQPDGIEIMADLNNEREAFAALLDHLMGARDAMRAIGLLRSDERWIMTARIMDKTKDHATHLMNAKPLGAKQRIWMPGQPFQN